MFQKGKASTAKPCALARVHHEVRDVRSTRAGGYLLKSYACVPEKWWLLSQAVRVYQRGAEASKERISRAVRRSTLSVRRSEPFAAAPRMSAPERGVFGLFKLSSASVSYQMFSRLRLSRVPLKYIAMVSRLQGTCPVAWV